jgi:hypothetical protein
LKKLRDAKSSTASSLNSSPFLEEIRLYRTHVWVDPKEDEDEHLNLDSLKFYRANKNSFSALTRLVHYFFCIPTSSVPSESLFSTAGQVETDLRSRLNEYRLEMLVFLKRNLHIYN